MKNKDLTDEELDRMLTEYMPKANILLDQLEEEKCKDISSHVFSKHYKKNMRKLLKEHGRTPNQKRFVALSKSIAVILIVLALINSILIVSVEAYREEIVKKMVSGYKEIIPIIQETIVIREMTVKDIKQNKVTITIKEQEKKPMIELDFVEPSYIPKGFESISNIQDDIKRKIEYINGEKTIVYIQSIIGKEETIIDREDLLTKKKKINNKTIYYAQNKGIYKVSWDDSKFNYSIIAEVPFEELIKIVEGIQK